MAGTQARLKGAKSSQCSFLNLPDGPLSLILAMLSDEDVLSVIETCWYAAQRTLQLASHFQPVLDVTGSSNLQISITLLALCKREDVILKVKGSHDYIKDQLAGMQTAAKYIGALNLTMVGSILDARDRTELTIHLSNALTPLTNYPKITSLEVAVTISCDWPEKAETSDCMADVPLAAIKELELTQENEVNTVLLVNTLCETVIPSLKNSIERLCLSNNISQDGVPLDKLTVPDSCQVVVNELHVDFVNDAVGTRLIESLKAGKITLAPDDHWNTLHLHHRYTSAERGDLYWLGWINMVKTQQPFHLHVHADGDCTDLWEALSDSDLHCDISELTITIENSCGVDCLESLIGLTIQVPVTVNVMHPYDAFDEQDSYARPESPEYDPNDPNTPWDYCSPFSYGNDSFGTNTDLDAVFKVYSSPIYLWERDQLCDKLQERFDNSHVERHFNPSSRLVFI